MRGGAFQRAGATLGTVEGELALNTLSEVADNIPTLYTLGYGSTSHHSAIDPVMIISSTDSILILMTLIYQCHIRLKISVIRPSE